METTTLPSERATALLGRMSQVFATDERCVAYRSDFEVDRRQVSCTAVPGVEYLWMVRECGTHLFILGVGALGDREEAELAAVRYLADQHGDDRADWYHARVKPFASVLCGINARRAVALVSGAARPIAAAWHSDLGRAQSGMLELSTRAGAFAGSATISVRPQSAQDGRILADASLLLAKGLTLCERMYATLEVEHRARVLASSLFFSFGEFTVDGQPVDSSRSSWCREADDSMGSCSRETSPPAKAAGGELLQAL